MKRLLVSLCAFAMVAYPALALADTFQIGNITNQRLSFSLRCNDGNDGWHAFKLKSMKVKTYPNGHWNYDCSDGRYQLRIGTNNDDGSVDWETIPIVAGNSYALVNSRQHHGFIAYDTRYMVAFRNDSNVTVNVNYRCTDGASGSGTAGVGTSGVGWVWVQNCHSYNLNTIVNNKDGTTTQLSRNVDANSIYRIVWSSEREGYELVKM